MVEPLSGSAKCGTVKNRRFLAGRHCVSFLGAIFPTQLFAKSCANLRPEWDSAIGPVTAWDEALYVFTSPIGIVCLGAFALAILTFRNTWLISAGVGAAVFGLLLYSTNLTTDPFEIAKDATVEGCIGSPAIAVVICGIICLICAGIFVIKRRMTGEQDA